MAIKNFDELLERLNKEISAQGGKKKTVAVVAADDAHALEAVIHAREAANAILVGHKEKISAVLEQLGKDPDDFNMVQVIEGEHPSVVAARLIHAGEADFLMKGHITTAELMKGVLSPEANLRTGALMSHVAMLEIPDFHKLIMITDSGMCTYPDLGKKKHIIENAVAFLHNLGYERPNVAVLAAVEVLNPKMPETVDAAALKQMNANGELTGCYVEGPISYDLAMVKEASKIKDYDCPCVGDFDILLTPDITLGNVLAKSLIYSAKSRMAGVITGAKVPIVLTSRSASSDEKFYSVVLSALVCP